MKLNKVPKFRRRYIFLLFFLLSCVGLSVAVFKNEWGLRTRLFFDTKIHGLSNIQDDQVIQRAQDGQTLINLKGRAGLLAKSIEVAVNSSQIDVIRHNDWATLDSSVAYTLFEGQVKLAPGWNNIFTRSKKRVLCFSLKLKGSW